MGVPWFSADVETKETRKREAQVELNIINLFKFIIFFNREIYFDAVIILMKLNF